MNTGAKFNRFLGNIQLTDSQINDAKVKHFGVRNTLHEYYYNTYNDGSTSILVGSYGKNTAVRPPTDIDILFIMPLELFKRYHSSTGNGQSQLLQDVKNVLLKKYPKTDIRGDGQVVVVSFVNSFGVDVLPVFSGGSDEKYLTPDTHSGGSWNLTNPSAEKKYISSSNNISKGNTVHLIKMLKVWKRFCIVPITSLAIELLVVPFIYSWKYSGNSSYYYDWMIRDFFVYMISNKNNYATIPGLSENHYFGDAWESKAKSALVRARKACKYESAKVSINDLLADVEWKKIFGVLFKG